jgi:hypothetical protein
MAVARSGSATDCSGFISSCVNDDPLWPHAGAAEFEAVGGTDVVSARQLGFGLVTSYISRPIALELRSPGGGSEQYAVNNQVDGTFLWAYGVGRRLELDLALPVTFGQDGAGLSPVTGGTGLHDTAVRDLRFGFTYALARHSWRSSRLSTRRGPSARLAVRLEISAPTGDRDQFAGERSGVFVPGLSAGIRADRLFAAAEVGARLRPTTELLGARVGSQMVAALGVGFDVLPRDLLSAAIEAWALPTLVGQDEIVLADNAYASRPTGAALIPAEWQISSRSSPLRSVPLCIQLGGGGGLPLTGHESITTPRFRFTLGIRWTPVVDGTARRNDTTAPSLESL